MESQPIYLNPVEVLTRISGVHIGLDIGQKSDYSALVVAEVGERPSKETYRDYRDGKVRAVPESIYRVQEVKRLPLGTPFGQVAQEVVNLAAAVRDFEHDLRQVGAKAPMRSYDHPLSVDIFADATGLGAPVMEMTEHTLRVSSKTDRALLHPITFTYGDLFNRETGSLGKAYLVSRLQVLLEHGRLELPKSNPTTTLMVDELLNYEIRIDPDANVKYGAFAVGTHDDLVTALGLACVEDPGYYTAQPGPNMWR